MKTQFETFYTGCENAVMNTEVGYPTEEGLSEITSKYLRADCLSFWRRHGDYIIHLTKHNPKQDEKIALAGCNFWHSRNNHPNHFQAGAWESPWHVMFDDAARGYGNFPVAVDHAGGIDLLDDEGGVVDD